MTYTLNRKNTVFYYIAIIVIAILLAVFYYNSVKVNSTEKWVEHTHKVIDKNNEILLDLINIETSSRGFLLTKNESFLEIYYINQKKIITDLETLLNLTKDNPSEQTKVKKLKKIISERVDITKSLITFTRKNNTKVNVAELIKGKVLTDSIRQNIKSINSEALSLLKQKQNVNASGSELSKILLYALLFLLVVLVFFIYYLFNNHKKQSVELEALNIYQKEASQYSLSLIEASRDPLFTISPDGKITDTNQASVRVTDVSKENLIGSDFTLYFTEPEKAKKGYEEVLSKGFVVDYPLIIKDGKLTPVLFNGSVYKDENDSVIGVVVVARDITEQKKAERELLQSLKEVTDYKLALDASAIVDITNQNGIILFVNENYLKISKYSSSELIGENHKKVNSNFHQKDFMKTLWHTISRGEIWQGEIRNTNKEGQHYWLNMTIVPFLDEKGLPYQYVAISIDITDQKKLETQLTEAKVFAELATEIAEEAQNKAECSAKIAVDAVKAKQQFLSNMSHEIRTPMNAIIGFTKVVLKTDLSTKQREYLAAIKMSGDALIVLINDILDLAKVDAGKMVFEQVPFKLHQSIKAMLHVFETKIQEKNLKLVTQYDKNIPEILLGDPVRLHQIILNLVSNAVKFTTHGAITVSVRLLNEIGEMATVEFKVSDTGIGISDEKLGSIFENFQQASSNTSRLYGGTGLGLAIVKQLVEQQGGTITVKSKIGEGSSFSFILDFPKTNDDAKLDTAIIEMDPDNKNIKVLVVEDMALNQLLMKTVLDDFGFERDIAENGQIAIDKLKTKSYDIVLMDLQMPVMNGFEATNYIRKEMNSKIPIIALTADVTTVDLVKCKAVGMNDYIAKPVDERLLYSKIIGLVKKPILEKRDKIESDATTENKNVKCIDLDYLYHRTKANPQLMMELIALYLVQTPPIIITMKQSLLDKNFELLHASMHKMIPSFSIMGISSDFEDIARKIQEYAGAQQFKDEIDDMALALEVVCDQACKELEIEYNLLKNTLP